MYARGHSRSEIFIDQADYQYFLSLLQRYLSVEATHNKLGIPYPHLYRRLELICYCLLPNHFHLLLYQTDEGAMPKLMRALLTSYTRYFNTKYHQTGPLYESRYKASRISDDSYLTHITRYIHLNRNDWQDTPYSSIAFYLRGIRADWLRPERIMTKFSGPADYRAFIAEYIPQKYILDTIKHELAD